MTPMRTPLAYHAFLLACALSTAACMGTAQDSSAPATGPGDKAKPPVAATPGPATGTPPASTPPQPAAEAPVTPPRAPYEALPPRVYAAKVKDLLTGLPLTADELTAVTNNPGAIKTLVNGWIDLPQFRDKMFEFFKSAFQQTQIDPSDLDDQIKLTSGGFSATDQKRMLKSVEESFARTVMSMVDEKRPFTETVTTTRFMMNLPLMVAYAYMDAAPQDDLGRAVTAGYWHLQKFKGLKYVSTSAVDANGQPVTIPFEESINPTSPNFMKFTFNQPTSANSKPCADPTMASGTTAVSYIFRALFGQRPGCNTNLPSPSQFTDDDWNSWRMVTVRKPKDGEERTTFWDLPKLRDPKTSELVLATPRVGFMTTPAFFANWPTNPSNTYRVTMNQALIVALGRSIDDRNATVQVSETSVDAQHVQPGTVCFACHQTLDPMRDFFKQSYSLSYSQQLDTKMPPPAEAKFDFGAPQPTKGFGVEVLAQGLANHPDFGPAWTQKLCHLANSTPCLEDDPVFKQVVTAFKSSKFDFKTLVRELYTSPLVTYASKTKTADDQGVVTGIARREAFCTRLSNRLNVKDACNMYGQIGIASLANKNRSLSLGVPGSSYSRADADPMMPHDPNLFFVSATEKLCLSLAPQLVDANAMSPWRAAVNKDAAINDFVSTVMGVPANDPRFAALTDILQRHYATAAMGINGAKVSAADALRSTFIVACSSPLAVSSGL